MAGQTKKNIDPLFQLFEHHLMTRSYDDSGAFTREVAEEYITYLDSTQSHVPLHVRANLLEDLQAETHEMLVKKMYGAVQPPGGTHYGKVMKLQGEEAVAPCDFCPPATQEDGTEKKS